MSWSLSLKNDKIDISFSEEDGTLFSNSKNSSKSGSDPPDGFSVELPSSNSLDIP